MSEVVEATVVPQVVLGTADGSHAAAVKYAFDGPARGCAVPGKSVAVGLGDGAVNTKTKSFLTGVAGKQMKDGPRPGSDLTGVVPDALSEMLAAKGASGLWAELTTKIAERGGGQAPLGWQGFEAEIAKVVAEMDTDFKEKGLEVFFCTNQTKFSSMTGDDSIAYRGRHWWLEVKDSLLVPTYVPQEWSKETAKEVVKLHKPTAETPLGVSFFAFKPKRLNNGIWTESRIIFANIVKDSIIEKAGIRPGDQLVSINGEPMPEEKGGEFASTLPRDTVIMLKACVGDIDLMIMRDRAEVTEKMRQLSLAPPPTDIGSGPLGCCSVM